MEVVWLRDILSYHSYMHVISWYVACFCVLSENLWIGFLLLFFKKNLFSFRKFVDWFSFF